MRTASQDSASPDSAPETVPVAPFIDGVFLSKPQGARLRFPDPSGVHAGLDYPSSGVAEVNQAVDSARRAYVESWQSMPPAARKTLLLALAQVIESHGEQLADLEVADIGKPIAMARGEAGVAAGFVRYYAEAIDKLAMGEIPATGTGLTEIQHLRPRGVVAAIVPWNFPLINACLKLGPALAAGNTCVVKPSEISPRSALLLAQLACEAGLPPGVFNVLPGDGAVGAGLAAHAGVDLVTFTGSTATGKSLFQSLGSSSLKPLLLECGGKSPEIVFDDVADLGINEIADRIVGGAFWNQGQVCVARSRILIHEPVYEALKTAIVEAAAKLQPGDPRDPETRFGPLASQQHYNNVRDYIALGVDSGCALLLDGRDPPGSPAGCYLAPSVFADVPETSALAKEEIFGPVICLMPFKDTADALRLANATDYGLAATVWTRDMARGMHLSQHLTAGKVRIQGTLAPAEPAGFNHSAEPCGQSGFGVEGGLQGMRSYLRRQSVEWVHG